jgi:hypothetical protein
LGLAGGAGVSKTEKSADAQGSKLLLNGGAALFGAAPKAFGAFEFMENGFDVELPSRLDVGLCPLPNGMDGREGLLAGARDGGNEVPTRLCEFLWRSVGTGGTCGGETTTGEDIISPQSSSKSSTALGMTETDGLAGTADIAGTDDAAGTGALTGMGAVLGTDAALAKTGSLAGGGGASHPLKLLGIC